MNLAYKYPIIYWNCACLISDSGSINADATTDYKKMARAIGNARQAGIKISLPDINRAQSSFVLDEKKNEILYGLKGLVNVGADVVDLIIQNRPYVSIKDFTNRVKINKQPMLSLIKGGAFDNLGLDRKLTMGWYLWNSCDRKKRITLQNLAGLIKNNLIPAGEEFQQAKRIFEFNRYLKDKCKTPIDKENYHLDIRAIDFLTSVGFDGLIEDNCLNIKEWNSVYQASMNVFRDWIKDNQDQILNTLNETLFLEAWNKNARGSLSAWEMESLCFYYHEHELAHINKAKYSLTNFNELPEQPQVERSFIKGGRTIHLYKIRRICGTCIAKDKNKGIISLLTTSGVINVKFRKEYFALFDKQTSEIQGDGTKKVIEKSWFTRGNKLIIQGIRQGESFIAKKYNSTPGHTLYRIDSVLNNGDVVLQDERIQTNV